MTCINGMYGAMQRKVAIPAKRKTTIQRMRIFRSFIPTIEVLEGIRLVSFFENNGGIRVVLDENDLKIRYIGMDLAGRQLFF